MLTSSAQRVALRVSSPSVSYTPKSRQALNIPDDLRWKITEVDLRNTLPVGQLILLASGK